MVCSNFTSLKFTFDRVIRSEESAQTRFILVILVYLDII